VDAAQICIKYRMDYYKLWCVKFEFNNKLFQYELLMKNFVLHFQNLDTIKKVFIIYNCKIDAFFYVKPPLNLKI